MLIVLIVDIFLQVWLVGDGLTDKEQSKAPKGTLFIPFSIFPPNQIRKDCYYHTTPAMEAPKSVENMHSCEVGNYLFDQNFLIQVEFKKFDSQRMGCAWNTAFALFFFITCIIALQSQEMNLWEMN